jgi:TRAP-type mannitol/chloroaromatic compound transport system permease large subunit
LDGLPEWAGITIIFVPIFRPLLKHFGIDPILWGPLVFVNLQAAFLSPPVAMSAFYLKGVAVGASFRGRAGAPIVESVMILPRLYDLRQHLIRE